ncbi:MAG: 2-hydroxyacyl-CoA dehydratase [Desulfobacteraceae bacterium]|nr:MAG: 2-hydroxyacyl-CoA dehydratase [Desulfobacteraceae bacterium]
MEIMTFDQIDGFRQAYEKRSQVLNELHAQGQKIFGYFCTYTPIELLAACKVLPVRIMGGRGKTEQCYNLLPEFICPFMKRSLEKALAGEYAFLSGIVQSYSCDAVCGCQAVWKNNFPDISLYSISLPYNDNPPARDFYVEEFQSLIKKLGQTTDFSFQEALRQAIAQYRKIREAVLMIYQYAQSGFLDISAEKMWYIVQAGFVMPPDSYLDLLNQQIREKRKTPVTTEKQIPVIVSGSEIGHPDILSYIEQKGGRIIWDDHCTGIRSFEPEAGCGNDPLECLVDRYMKRLPCASRSRAEDRWPEWDRRLQYENVQGVIFILQKFCTPHLSDIPYFKNQLKNNGIPSIVVEMDEGWEVSGQIRTRIDSFLDMI